MLILLLGALFALSSPSLTLGSTQRPDNDPSGAPDADPNDYTGALWIVGGRLDTQEHSPTRPDDQ